MALTYIERQQVQDGEVHPATLSLTNLISLIAVDFAIDFRTNYKTFDGSSFPDAQIYLDTMLGLCRQVLNYDRERNQGILNSFIRDFITILGRTAYTYSQLQTATDQQWENFIKTGNPASSTGYAGVLLLFETVAGVTKAAKTEYDAQP